MGIDASKAFFAVCVQWQYLAVMLTAYDSRDAMLNVTLRAPLVFAYVVHQTARRVCSRHCCAPLFVCCKQFSTAILHTGAWHRG